jgi:hypothetical protein
MCSKKELIQYINSQVKRNVYDNNFKMKSLGNTVSKLISNSKFKWNSKNDKPFIDVDSDFNSINLTYNHTVKKSAKVTFKSMSNNNVTINAYISRNGEKKCYINISWDECISVISNIIPK